MLAAYQGAEAGTLDGVVVCFDEASDGVTETAMTRASSNSRTDGRNVSRHALALITT